MDTEKNILISINLVTLIISFPGNIFILVVIILDFLKNRRLLLSDQLIFGFSFFTLLHGLQKGCILCKQLLQLPIDEYDNKAAYVFMFFHMGTIWSSALLCIYFCLKIVNINQRFYTCLQKRLPKLFPWVTLTFLLGHFFICLLSALESNQECLRNTTSNVVSIKMSPRCSWSLLVFITMCILYVFLCSVSALTILISLFKHINRIQENTEGSRSPNMAAHIRAIRTVSSLLTANVLIFIFVFTTLFRFLLVYPFGILISICHIVSSYCLIKGTKKLDKTLIEILNRCSRFSGQTQ